MEFNRIGMDLSLGNVYCARGKWKLRISNGKKAYKYYFIYRSNGSQPKDYAEARDIANNVILKNYRTWKLYEFAIGIWDKLVMSGVDNKTLIEMVDYMFKNGYTERMVYCEIIKLKFIFNDKKYLSKKEAKKRIFDMYKDYGEIGSRVWSDLKYQRRFDNAVESKSP